jgi:hypothetical protein
VIFGGIAYFYLFVPAISNFSILGIACNDKLFSYVIALQLLLHSSGGAVSGILGLLSGLIYFSSSQLQSIRFPRSFNRITRNTIAPLIDANSTVWMFDEHALALHRSAQRDRNLPASDVNLSANGNGNANANAFVANPEALQALQVLGFDRNRAIQALALGNPRCRVCVCCLLTLIDSKQRRRASHKLLDRRVKTRISSMIEPQYDSSCCSLTPPLFLSCISMLAPSRLTLQREHFPN